AINALAEQIANIPFLFSAGDRGRETLITTGPLPDFYNHPHPQVNRFQYWELRVIWLMLRGECFRVPIFSDSHNLNHNPDLNRSHSLSAGGEGRGEVVPFNSPPSHSLSAGGEGRGELVPFSSLPSHSLSAGGEGRGEVAPSRSDAPT